ncbi:MAG TPA: RNB domain-containing ribonuclease [bacterium]|nr:RNB domain-containing ribonuclease [bacterium]
MKGHGEKLTRKQEQAIAALLAEPTLGSAARRCGVSETTLWRWLQDEEFQAAYKNARRSAVDAATTCLQQAATEAVACLRRALTCGQVAAEVRAAGQPRVDTTSRQLLGARCSSAASCRTSARPCSQRWGPFPGPTATQIPSVRELSGLLWASIDNDDSLDLDQLSVAEPLADGRVKVLVAIADVDALVGRASAIDALAQHNATSVYRSHRSSPCSRSGCQRI